MSKTLSRYDFLRIAGYGAASILPHAGLLSKLTDLSSNYTLSQAKARMSDPEFYRTPDQNGRRIITPQEKYGQYDATPEQYTFRNNTCTFAAIASLTKLYHFLVFNEIPDIEIDDIILSLIGKTAVDRTGIEHNIIDWDMRVFFDGLAYAIENYTPLGRFVSARLMTFDWGSRHVEVVNKFEWPALFDEAESVCDKGGAIFLFCKKRGSLHYVDCINFKSKSATGETIVLDSYDGSVFETNLKNWLPPSVIEDDHKERGPQSPLYGMIALEPKFSFAVQKDKR